MRYPIKPFFFMRAYFPGATPQQLIGNPNLKQNAKKEIPNSINGSSKTCKMRYSQLAFITQSTTVANQMLFTKKQVTNSASMPGIPGYQGKYCRVLGMTF